MTDSPRPRTTKYGPRSRGNLGRYDSTTPPPAEHVSYAPDRVGLQYGWVKIINPEVRYTRRGWHTPMMATRAQNQANRRNTILAEFHQEEWPYEERTTRRKLRVGYTREEIIEQARLAVKEKRKNWRGTEQRLRSMTS